jgi:hypothetical protein
MLIEKNWLFRTLCYLASITTLPKLQICRCNHPILKEVNIGGYLANICNSTIIEMYDDMFWISLTIQALKRLEYTVIKCWIKFEQRS